MAPPHRLSSLVPVHRRPPWGCMQISLRPGSRLFFWKVAVGHRWGDIRTFPQTPITGYQGWAATWQNDRPGTTARQDWLPFRGWPNYLPISTLLAPPTLLRFSEGPWVISAMISFANLRHYRRSHQFIPSFLTWNSHFLISSQQSTMSATI